MYIKKLGEENNVNGDNIGFVKHYDFSQANMNDISRIEAITTVASICYDNPNAVGRESLYNRLKAESLGLPSSSFEFVPILLNNDRWNEVYSITFNFNDGDAFQLQIEKYGEWLTIDNKDYLLTNYRALLRDWENLGGAEADCVDFTQYFNTEEECAIINKYSTTFLYKMDMNTSKQHNRHRASLQELSRRYVSGKKTEFEFYISEGMKDVVSLNKWVKVPDDIIDGQFSTKDLTQLCVDHYFAALDQGIKAQEARRILPQSMYTTIWTAFLPFQLNNYLALRDDSHAQDEIRWLAQAMKRLLGIN